MITLSIIAKSKELKPIIDKYYYRNIKIYTPYLGSNGKISKTIAFYKKIYNENLTNEEQTILALYTIINDDYKLTLEYIRTKGDFKLIGKMYNVTPEFAILRWKIQRKIKKYENSKKLTLENK